MRCGLFSFTFERMHRPRSALLGLAGGGGFPSHPPETDQKTFSTYSDDGWCAVVLRFGGY